MFVDRDKKESSEYSELVRGSNKTFPRRKGDFLFASKGN